jgi:hypothetical protein
LNAALVCPFSACMNQNGFFTYVWPGFDHSQNNHVVTEGPSDYNSILNSTTIWGISRLEYGAMASEVTQLYGIASDLDLVHEKFITTPLAEWLRRKRGPVTF